MHNIILFRLHAIGPLATKRAVKLKFLEHKVFIANDILEDRKSIIFFPSFIQ